jgi:hypothetical protein
MIVVFYRRRLSWKPLGKEDEDDNDNDNDDERLAVVLAK